MNRKLLRLLTAVVPAALLLAATSSAKAQGLNTSTAGCTATNVNLYNTRQDVYLSGNPNDLDPGAYYLRVEGPGGAPLGKSNGATFVITDVTSCQRLWDLVKKVSNPAEDGYDPTPNTGGEYKVVASKEEGGPGKSDNYKIKNNGGGDPQGCQLGISAAATKGCESASIVATVSGANPDGGAITVNLVKDNVVVDTKTGSATDTQFTFTGVAAGDYLVDAIQGVCFNEASVSASVQAKASIDVQPSAVVNCIGQTSTVSISASNYSSISWEVSVNSGDWVPYGTGGTSVSVTPTNTVDVYVFRATVHDIAPCDGSVLSETATVQATPASIVVTKVYDANGNGPDSSDAPIQGIKVSVDGNTQQTGPDGTATFSITSLGSHAVAEVLPAGWIATKGTDSVNVDGSLCTYYVTLSNVCTTTNKDARTMGFWQGTVGQGLLILADFTGPRAYPLNDYKTNFYLTANFTLAAGFGTSLTTAKANLAKYINNANASTNGSMSFMLSAQADAMSLNVNHLNDAAMLSKAGSKGVDAGLIVYAPGIPASGITGLSDAVTLESKGFFTVARLLDLAKIWARNTENISLRPFQLAIKNALDAANNGKSFVSTTACGVTY